LPDVSAAEDEATGAELASALEDGIIEVDTTDIEAEYAGADEVGEESEGGKPRVGPLLADDKVGI
jgi:hypothetical protein